MSALLAAFRVQVRYWRRHRIQAVLCFGGIVLGVAVFCAIQLANQGALRAFSQGVEALAGRATHRVFSPAGEGVPEALFVRLTGAPGVEAAAPLLRERFRLRAGQQPPRPLTALGLDPVSDAAFRGFRFLPSSGAGAGARAEAEVEDPVRLLERFLAEPDAVVLPRALARRLGLAAGALLEAESPRGPLHFRVLALFDPPPESAAAFSDAVVHDVAAHQEAFAKLGRVDTIQLILAPGAEGAVRALLPPGVALEAAGGRVERVEHMSRAFRLNLESLGLFALLVAMFLIFNAAGFSVAQRERTLAMLRCIGATSRTVFLALMGEALGVGLLGGVLGVLAGRVLGALMLRNTGATLFEVVLNVEAQPATVALDGRIWAIGMGLGVGVSLLGAVVPALAGSRVSPLAAVQAMRQAAAVSQSRFPWRGWLIAAAGGLALAGVLVLLPGRSLVAGLAAATALALGMAALCPPLVAGVSHFAAAPLGWALGPPGRMAARNLGRSLARTGVAAASLMIALSLALSIEITVRSFKRTLEVWLDQVLTADLYLEQAFAGPAAGAAAGDSIARLRGLPFVADVAELHSRHVVFRGREVQVLALQLPAYRYRASLPLVEGEAGEAYRRLEAGEVFVSEALAFPFRLRRGQPIALPTPRGEQALTIAGVVRNYSAPQGIVYLSVRHYLAHYGPEPPEGMAVWLQPGTDPLEAQAALEVLPELAHLRIIPNGSIRALALKTFDRTFVITDLMGALAAFVAFMAVVSALTALLEERMRTLGYLRAVGVSRRALGASLALEASLLAGTAALASWVTGPLMAWLLVFVINRRAFGWTLQFLPGEGSYGALLLLAVGAGLLGSVYPIYRATRLSIVATIREE